MATVTKKDLIDRIAITTGAARSTVKSIAQQFLDEMVAELGKGNRIEFREFGVFEPRIRSARVAQNPKTMQRVTVPAKLTVRFKSGREMREAMERRALAHPQVVVTLKPMAVGASA